MIESHDTKTWFAVKTGLAAFFVFVAVLFSGLQYGWLMLSGFAVLTVAYIWILYRYVKVELSLRSRDRRITAFAQRYGYSVSAEAEPHKTKTFSRVLEPRLQKFSNTIHGDNWRYSDLSYTTIARTKYGDIDADVVYYSVLELDLSRPLPNMLFDAPQAHGLAFLAEIDEYQRTSLEGDFDQFFVTYFPSRYHIDSRSIITPEVMAAMIDSGVSDIEISGKKLYLYSPLIEPKDLDNFINDGMTIRAKMMDHAVKYRDDRLDKPARDKGDVSHFGKSLMAKPKFPWNSIITIVILAIYFSIAAMNPTEPLEASGVLGYIAVLSGMLILAGWKINISWVKPRRAISRREKSYDKKHGR
jgi:hypothetical protein